MSKKILASTVAVICVLTLSTGWVAWSFTGSAGQVCEEGATCNYNEAEGGEFGAVASPYFESQIYANAGIQVGSRSIAYSGATSTVTLTSADSGKTIFLSASGTTVTLPDVDLENTFFRFQVNGDIPSLGNFVIDSAEGDNIEGTLIVAGAVVDCDAEDQINIIDDGENIGDYVEVMSDGDQWLIQDSGVLSSGKMTCTDPS
jgi:hypothetical protein